MKNDPPSYTNPDELFDVVDTEDRVITQAARRDVHDRHFLHRAVHVLVHNSEGLIFLQRRSPLKDTFPNCWDSSCSGHLNAGETYAPAARRELGEEIGWHDLSQPLRHVVKLEASPATGYEFIEIFLLGPIAGPFTLNAEEITEGRWIHPRLLDVELRTAPDKFAGALRLLWAEHGAKITSLLPAAD